jgi:D-3-phosphoglycerate dehydrogenase
MKAGKWKKNMGFLLSGKTLGIIGLGTIGKELVRIASGFGFHILAFDEQEDELFAKDNDVTYCELENLLKSSDIVTIHLNLSDQTKLLIDKEKVKLMKPEAILINTSRGEIIDENALYEALINSWIGGAGLDVFENEPYTGPLTKLDNVVLTPHIGAYAKEIRIKMEVEAAENLIRGLNEL